METRLARGRKTELSEQSDQIQSFAVTRVGNPLRAALVVVPVIALLAGCGSSDSSSNETTATRTSATSAGGGSGGQDQNGPQDSGKGGAQNQGGGSGGGRRQQQGGGSGSKDVATPLKVPGGGSAQFVVKGGDNSIQEYGDEGSESELRQAAEITHNFLVARVEGKWDTACSYLAKRNAEQLEQLVAQGGGKEGCGAAMQGFTQPAPPSVEREITTVDAGSFRHEGTQGFLIYYGAGHTVYSMPMVEEGGAWKVAALAGTAIS